MSLTLQSVPSFFAWVWRHIAAGVALILITLALIIGFKLGRPAPEPSESAATDSSVQAADAAPKMYTCSMHPSVRLPDPKAKCPICFMDLIPVADDTMGEGAERRITINAAAAATSRIETAKVGRFFPLAEVRLYGKITYDETSVARLTAYFPGRIDRLFVNYLGVPVNKGDHIAQVYSPELLAAFEELRQSRGATTGSRTTSDLVRAATRDTLAASREKLRLFGLTPEQIVSVEDGSFSSDHLTIFAPIGGVVTHLAVRQGDYVTEGSPIATVADLSHLWLDLQAYESQLPYLRWGQRVAFTVEAHPGESFEGQISFIEPMVDDRTRTAAVRVAVDNTGHRLKPGMFASAVMRPRVSANGAVVGGELAGRWVSPMHPNIVKDGPGQCDICGMDLVPAESLGIVGDPAAAEEPLVIPRSAVLFTGARSVVYVAVEDAEKPTYEGREVTLGPRAGEFYLIRDGLREGESVVVNGAFRIDSAMQITAKPSMMSPAGGDGGDPHAGHAPMGAKVGANAASSGSVPDAFIASLASVYTAYLTAQEALAADDLGAFSQAAENLKTSVAAVSESGLVGETLAEWRRSAAKLRLDRVYSSIDEARIRFERMSDGAIALQRRFGHAEEQTWSLAHCPMAFDNKGADWLQRGEQINNPYFGDMMLRCGSVRESFAPIKNSDASPKGAGREGHNHE